VCVINTRTHSYIETFYCIYEGINFYIIALISFDTGNKKLFFFFDFKIKP